jgi:hydroxyacylglutathione hydrolase
VSRSDIERLDAARIAAHLASGGRLLDVREPPMFAEAHVRGSLNIPLSSRSAPYWLSIMVDPVEPLTVITATERESVLVAQLLAIAERAAIGVAAFDRDRFAAAGLDIASIRTLTPEDLESELDRLTVVDVREQDEWVGGHVPGALWIPLAELPKRVGDVPAGSLATICMSGFRSSTAASVLEAAGHREIANVWGGTTAWAQHGYPVRRGRAP